ncbi:hypothetical protein ILYODFUR_016299 [Ilyodon furcidens]|uniref:Uncharacterized protein n=1 Tax=Ilyodon furcidens TaxID=33524 RepID=A0ABV0TXY4_9TELE
MFNTVHHLLVKTLWFNSEDTDSLPFLQGFYAVWENCGIWCQYFPHLEMYGEIFGFADINVCLFFLVSSHFKQIAVKSGESLFFISLLEDCKGSVSVSTYGAFI